MKLSARSHLALNLPMATIVQVRLSWRELHALQIPHTIRRKAIARLQRRAFELGVTLPNLEPHAEPEFKEPE